jgi:hypothetical protein
MRVEGLADNEIAGLFRHAADELDETTMTKDGEVDPAAWTGFCNSSFAILTAIQRFILPAR